MRLAIGRIWIVLLMVQVTRTDHHWYATLSTYIDVSWLGIIALLNFQPELSHSEDVMVSWTPYSLALAGIAMVGGKEEAMNDAVKKGALMYSSVDL
ncbi:hypothetical protein EDD18DRAFT_1218524 [Armillaria luteobubalina]|uniref:Uncharacterized protein n=1 Tax=Armillaria luteobubalina TaxID=153913 RepID=A0AA39TA33_9AGAR|nr:hypothetical protein EDD18DRAFT_1218524 [Armillaria luteobubalina]